jgi:hypothetical protein
MVTIFICNSNAWYVKNTNKLSELDDVTPVTGIFALNNDALVIHKVYNFALLCRVKARALSFYAKVFMQGFLK